MAIFRSERVVKGWLSLAVLGALAASSAACAAGTGSPDWKAVEAETIEHYTALLRIDTSNPPGNEARAAEYLKAVLARDGISSKLLALDPARANLVARLKGNGSKQPLLLMGHTDVVGVQRAKWSVDPFAAVRKGGYVYGRGAQDDKDNLTAALMVTLLLKRLRVPLDRDVIFLAEAGEEGTMSLGIDFLVERHWDEIRAEYALAEGGAVVSEGGETKYVSITTTEKVPRRIRLVAHGTAGHGSRPTPDNAVVRLATAVARIGAWQPPVRLNETTRAYFERLAAISPPERAARYKGILDPNSQAEIDRYFFQYEPGHYSILRTSITPTMIQAGFRVNVIPSEAEARLDVRALPDEDYDRLCEELRRKIDDRQVEVIPEPRGSRPAAQPSRMDSEMFRALERAHRRLYPHAVTIPGMLTGATDMAQLRARGVQAYGIGPDAESDDGLSGAHSDDERLSEKALHRLVEFLWYAVRDVASSK